MQGEAVQEDLLLLLLQATARDPACAEHRHDMSLDTKRLVALKSTLQKGQDIWLEMYFQVFKNVRCLSLCCWLLFSRVHVGLCLFFW